MWLHKAPQQSTSSTIHKPIIFKRFPWDGWRPKPNFNSHIKKSNLFIVTTPAVHWFILPRLNCILRKLLCTIILWNTGDLIIYKNCIPCFIQTWSIGEKISPSYYLYVLLQSECTSAYFFLSETRFDFVAGLISPQKSFPTRFDFRKIRFTALSYLTLREIDWG